MLLGLSAMTPLSRLMSPVAPMPFYLVLLTWLMSFGSVLVVPAIYAVTFPWLCKSARFGAITLAFVLIVALLDALWFRSNWAYGVEYQGLHHTRTVAIENALVSVVAVGLAVLGRARKTQAAFSASYLLVFAGLAWCAFPYLGEVP